MKKGFTKEDVRRTIREEIEKHAKESEHGHVIFHPLPWPLQIPQPPHSPWERPITFA